MWPPAEEDRVALLQAFSSPRRIARPVREEVREWLLLMGKSVVFVVGGVLVMAGAVDLAVDGPGWLAAGVLLVGLLFTVPFLYFAFRDAVRDARSRRAP